MARPAKLKPDETTLKTLRTVGQLCPTMGELASILEVSESTLFKFLGDHPQAKDALERGKANATLSLRRRMLVSNSPHVMIFIAKNLLGWTDRTETINRNIEVTDKYHASDDELLAVALGGPGAGGR